MPVVKNLGSLYSVPSVLPRRVLFSCPLGHVVCLDVITISTLQEGCKSENDVFHPDICCGAYGSVGERQEREA